MLFRTSAFVLAAAALGLAQAQKQDLDGVRNFTKVDATVACAGATELRAIPELARLGYRSIVNLRLETEAGAEIAASREAATAAGLTYLHLPFDGSAPDEKVADAFIKAVTDESHQPVFIHCGSANRVGALWLAKRMLVDKWSEAKALEEAKLIGLTSAALERFALAYVASRQPASAP